MNRGPSGVRLVLVGMLAIERGGNDGTSMLLWHLVVPAGAVLPWLELLLVLEVFAVVSGIHGLPILIIIKTRI